MAELKPFLIMSKLAAARLAEQTAGDPSRVEPREIMNAPYKGQYALPERVKFDDELSELFDAFAVLEVVALDPDVAFPPTPEELAARAAAEIE